MIPYADVRENQIELVKPIAPAKRAPTWFKRNYWRLCEWIAVLVIIVAIILVVASKTKL